MNQFLKDLLGAVKFGIILAFAVTAAFIVLSLVVTIIAK